MTMISVRSNGELTDREGVAMHGADVDRLTVTARAFIRSSHDLATQRAALGSVMGESRWVGADAERSRADWRLVGAPALLRTSAFLEHLGSHLLRQAAEQRAASGTIDVGAAVGFWSPVQDAIDELVDTAREVVGDALDSLADLYEVDGGGDAAGSTHPDPAVVRGLRPAAFTAPSDGRGAVVAAMGGMADEERIAPDEIEIRALDTGRYIVVLPGVTDLSQGVEQFVDQLRDRGPLGVPDAGRDALDSWADNDEPTVRKMRYAYEAALRDDTTVNEYSVATIRALQAAGVPSGAEVMLVGHSFGAYAAMDLAADPSFNAEGGADPTGYQVEVTHVIAAGAETDWRFDEIPAKTEALVINNRFDAVYRAEDLLHRDGDAIHPGHLEHNFWGGWQGYGHDEHNYIDWLSETGDDDVEAWLAGVGDRYAAGGTRVSARVPDPNL